MKQMCFQILGGVVLGGGELLFKEVRKVKPDQEKLNRCASSSSDRSVLVTPSSLNITFLTGLTFRPSGGDRVGGLMTFSPRVVPCAGGHVHCVLGYGLLNWQTSVWKTLEV